MDTKKEPEVYWIVSEGNEVEDGEFGVEIDGVPYFYYKWPDASPSPTVKYRRVNKREFRSEEHTSELQSHHDIVCRLLLEKKKQVTTHNSTHKMIEQKKKNVPISQLE